MSLSLALLCGFVISAGADASGCAAAGSFKTADSTHDMEGGQMYCKYPTGTSTKFPLLSFEHGDTQGGPMLHLTYGKYFEAMASSGFVICAPLMCTVPCREQQHVHQLNAITAAKALGSQGVLPVRSEGAVGVVGHSTGGMTVLKCAAKDAVSKHGIGAAVAYNGDGGAILKSDNVSFAEIEPSLPMFLVTGSGDTIEPAGSTQGNTDSILKANPKQPLLVAEIDGEGHLDSIDIPLVHPAPLKAAPYIIAFFGHTLMPSSQCTKQYEKTMGTQLKDDSSKYYKNKLFGTASDFIDDLFHTITQWAPSVKKAPCKGCGTLLGPVFVDTPLGNMEGALWERVNGTKTAAFIGIPYAIQKRFEKASPVPKWEGVLDATKRGPACPQGGTIPGMVLEDISEDCLVANVFAPAAGLNGSHGASRPVLFWLHGGGLTIGSAYSQALGKMFDALNIENIYDGQRMAAQGDVVVVSVNYRLGVLGFTPFGDSSGNLGFLDQQEGLRWVKKVAHSFGGDPEKITIFGESAGGESVLFHLASPLSKNLFQKAIVESGSLDGRSLNETKQHGVEIAKKLSCSGGDILSCMKSKSYQEVIKAQGGYDSMGSVGATIDGTVLPAGMHDLFESGNFNKCPMIIGNNLDEASIFGGCRSITEEEYKGRIAKMYTDNATASEVLKLYPAGAYPHPRDAMVALESDDIFCRSNRQIADMTVKAGVPTFRYRFVRSAWFLRLMSLVSGKDAPYCVGVPHAAELIDVWGTFDALFSVAPGDLKLSQQTIQAWTNFAHSGNPNFGGPMEVMSPRWNPHTSQSDTTYLFDAGPTFLHPRGAVKSHNVVDLLADRCPILSKSAHREGDPAQASVNSQTDGSTLETVMV